MGCTRPLSGYRGPGGKVFFTSKDGYVDRPITVKCGQCLGCRLRRTQDWAVRCVHEAQMHSDNVAVTLTYDDEHLPEDSSVSVKHWQDFCDRVRYERGPFRYLHTGEYGETNTLRPHYHGLLFGMSFPDPYRTGTSTRGHPVLQSEDLTRLWGNGIATIAPVNFATASYTARYTIAKASFDDPEQFQRIDPETGEWWEVKPTYSTMSLRPGIGNAWYKRWKKEVYPSDFITIKGQIYRPPLYYDKLLEGENPDLFDSVRLKRRNKIKTDDHTHERLRTIENCTQARVNHHSQGDLL